MKNIKTTTLTLCLLAILFNDVRACEGTQSEDNVTPLTGLLTQTSESEAKGNKVPPSLDITEITPLIADEASPAEEIFLMLSGEDAAELRAIETPHNQTTTTGNYFIKQAIFIEELIARNLCLDRTSFTLKGTALLVCSTAGVPLIVFARGAFPFSEALAWSSAGATVLCIAASRSWAAIQLLPDLNLLRSELKSLSKKELSVKITKNLLCHITGFLSSLPFSYAVYTHNTTKILALSTLISEYALGTYGYVEFLNSRNIVEFLKTLFCCGKDKLRVVMNKSKSRLISAANNVIPNISSLDDGHRSELILSMWDNKQYRQNPEEFLNVLIDIDQGTTLGLHQYFKPLAKFLACGIPASYAFQSTIMALNSSTAVNTSPWFAAAYTFVTVTPSLVIGLVTTTETMDDIYDSVFCLGGKSFMQKYYPKTRIAILGSSFITSVLTACSGMFLTYDTIGNSILKESAIYFTVMSGAYTVIFESYEPIAKLFNAPVLFSCFSLSS